MKSIHRMLSILLVCCMMLSGLPTTALSNEVHENEYTDTEVEVSPDMAAGLVAMLTGEDPGEPIETDNGYVFDMPDSMVDSLAAAIDEAGDDSLDDADTVPVEGSSKQDESSNEDVNPTEGEEASAEDVANVLPDDYVDNSNDALYAMLEDMAGTPAALDDTLSGMKIDLFFVIDSTGSMSDSIDYVKANVAEFARTIGATGATLRLGLIDYRDIEEDGNDSTTTHEPGYSPWMDVPGFITELTTVSADGGGDTPETPIDALGNLVQSGVGWNSDAYKFAMLITDADYKTNNNHGIANMGEMIRLLQEKGIIVSTITPDYVASDYGELAGLTGGVQITLSGNFADDMMDFAEAIIGTVDIGRKPTRDYTLRILDSETGLPVSGASVTWTGGATATDDSGIARIVSADSPVRNVKVTRSGYITKNLGDLYDDTDVALTTMTADPDSDAEDIPTLTPSMFKNPDSGNGTLRGPSLSFIGKTFNLLDNIDIGLDLPIFSKIQMSNDKEKKLFMVTFGNDSDTVSNDPDNSYWKNDYPLYKSVVQSFKKGKSAKEIYNDFRTLRKSEKAKTGKFTFPIEFKLAGYAEASYASGSIDSVEGGIVIGATTKEFEHVAYFPPQPWIFLKVTFQADLTGRFGIFKVESIGKKYFTLEAKGLEANATATITLNAGAKHLAYVGGGLKGNLKTELDLPIPDRKLENALKILLEGKFTVEVKLLGFKASKDFGELGPAQLYPWGERSAALLSLDGFDNDFAPIERPTPIMARAEGAYDYEKNAVYEDSAPQLIQLPDGTMLLVWVDAVAGRSDANMTGLYYAYKPTGGSWSVPALVSDDGTSDFMPVLAVGTDGSPVLVWQNVKTAWTSAPEKVEDVAANIEVKSAVYNKTNNTFESVATLPNSAGYSTAVQLVPSVSGVAAYWIETKPENLLLGEDLNATICTSSWNGSAWDTSSTVATVSSLDGFTVGQIGGDNCIAYAEGSTITADGATLTANGTVSSLQIAGGSLYWSDANGLNEWTGSGEPVCDATLAPDDFTVLTNGGRRVLLIRQYTDDAHELYASVYTSSGWSTPIPVTDYGNLSLSDPSAVLVSDGSICWACGRVGNGSDLVVDSYTPVANVVVGSDAYISDMITAGETAYASVDLSNTGLSAAPVSATVQIGGMSQSATICRFSEDEPETVTQLNAGEYLDAGIRFMAPASMNGETVTIAFTDAAGNVLGTATGTLPSAAPDIEVKNAATDGTAVTATITNIGAAPASNVTMNLTQEGVEETLGTQVISLPVGASQTVSFTIGTGAKLTPDTRYDYKRFIVTAEPAVNEVMLGNNSDSTLIAPKTVESVAIDGEKLVSMKGGEKLSLTYTITPAGAPTDVAWMSTKNSVATVDDHGTVSAWNDGEADIIVSYILDDGTALQDEITVTVTEGIPNATGVNGVTINPSSVSVGIDKTATLTAIVSPSSAIDKSVTWHVENENVLRITPGVDNTLLVEGVAAGKTTVTVRTNDGAYTATATITVSTSTDSGSSTGGSSSSGGGYSGGSSSSNSYAISVPSRITGGKVQARPTSAEKGSKVTLTVTPDAGFELDVLTVKDSKENSIDLVNEGEGRYTFIMPASKVSVNATFVRAEETPTQPAISFTDVPSNAYYYDAVAWAVENGITAGTSATTFSPNAPCTRAQVVTFLWRAAGSPKVSSSNPFTDVASGKYYYDAVLWAVEKGITVGTSATTFSPDTVCTRAQIVTFLYRYKGSPAVSGSNTFGDVAANAYYATAVDWAVSAGVTVGTGNNTFSPSNNCTRAQTVTFLYRSMA